MRIGRVAGTAATVTFHSVHSAGGELEAGELALAARAAGLDFVVATGGRWRGGPRARRMRDAGGVCVAAHPHAPYPSGAFKGVAHRAELPTSLSTSRSNSGSGEVTWETSALDAGFVRVEVRHPEGSMAALSNPIIVS